jgi:RNA polymerase sigma-70 factor, ECF subfamily
MPLAAPSPEPDPDLQDSLYLVRQAQAGESLALGELFARYYPLVRALVIKRLSSDLKQAMDVEDLVQDAMVDAIRGFDGFEVRSRQELIGWFARIVENAIKSAQRHQHALKRDRSREVSQQFIRQYLDQSAADFQPAADDPSPSQLMGAREQGSILEVSLSVLDDAQRRAIELRNGQGASWAEIAEILGKASPDAARMLYVRARLELQKEMKRRGGDPLE